MSKGEETRRQILDEALALASEVGLERVSIGALAERASLSKSGLFAHFQSKEALELAIIEHAVDRFVSEVVSPALRAPRGEPRVRALLERWLGWSHAKAMPGGCVFVTSMSNAGKLPAAVRQRLLGTQKDWLDTLATAVRIAISEGHFRPDVDAAQLAHELLSVAYGNHLIARLLDPEGRDERWRAATEHLLASARAKPAVAWLMTGRFTPAAYRSSFEFRVSSFTYLPRSHRDEYRRSSLFRKKHDRSFSVQSPGSARHRARGIRRALARLADARGHGRRAAVSHAAAPRATGA